MELFFGILTIAKRDLEAEKALFQGLAWHSQLIFGLWNSRQCNLDEVEKALIQIVYSHFDVILCFLTYRNCEFFQVDIATIQVANGT